jgi:hypothetical protein
MSDVAFLTPKRLAAALVAIGGLALLLWSITQAPTFTVIAAVGTLAGVALAALWVRQPQSKSGLGTVLAAGLAGSYTFLFLGRFEHLEDAAFFLLPLNLGAAAGWWALTGYRYEHRNRRLPPN